MTAIPPVGPCKGKPELFLALDDIPRHLARHKELLEECRAICDTCPVRIECLRYALEHDVQTGVIAGHSPQMRQFYRYGKERPHGNHQEA